MEFFILLLILSIIVNIFLIRRSFRIMDELQNLYNSDMEYKQYVSQRVKSTLEKMREIDTRGSFESDDEVGAIFNELKATLQETTELLLNEKKEK